MSQGNESWTFCQEMANVYKTQPRSHWHQVYSILLPKFVPRPGRNTVKSDDTAKSDVTIKMNIVSNFVGVLSDAAGKYFSI